MIVTSKPVYGKPARVPVRMTNSAEEAGRTTSTFLWYPFTRMQQNRRQTTRSPRRLRTILIAMLITAALAAGFFVVTGQTALKSGSEPFRIPSTVTRIAQLEAYLDDMTPATVTRVVDGDTVVIELIPPAGLESSEKVRLIGVDTPETKDPRKPVQHFGPEASEHTRRLVDDKRVLLAFEPALRDYYGRLLAYVFLEDGTCVNLAIVEDGYGHAYTKYPFLFTDDFILAERKARTRKAGLWGPP